MSSRAETLGGESRVLEPSAKGNWVESPLCRGAFDSSVKERTGEPWWEMGIVQIQWINQSPNKEQKINLNPKRW